MSSPQQVPTTPKAAFHLRLEREGRYRSYERLKAKFKDDGVPITEAWLFAAAEFPPLDGSPHEIKNLPPRQQHEHAVDRSAGSDAFISGDDCGDLFSDVQSPAVGSEELERNGSGEPIAATQIPSNETVHPASRERRKVHRSRRSEVIEPPEPAPKKKSAKERAREAMQEEEAYFSLYSEIPSNRTATMKADAFWIMANIDALYATMPADDVPSRAALSMLRKIKEGQFSYKDFVSTFYSKFIPTRPTDDGEGGQGGGDGEYMAAMQAVESAFYKNGASIDDRGADEEIDEEAPDVEPYDNVDDDDGTQAENV